jgi:hypothetical protein
MSFAESLANVLVGYCVMVLAQLIFFPVFGVSISLSGNLTLSGLFTVISIARSYSLRRLFETLYDRRRLT